MGAAALRVLKDRGEIEGFLRGDPALHVYSIGDLDDFFWPHTTWFGWEEEEKLTAVFLLYTGTDLPVLLALEEKNHEAARALLRKILPALPAKFYCHLSTHLEESLRAVASLERHGRHLKMSLRAPQSLRLPSREKIACEPLGPSDLARARALYDAAYPSSWFDPRMLETGQYVGAFQGGEIVGIAGVHVFSPRFRVAALGNITTLPRLRGQGVAAVVTAQLCANLFREVDLIGLNVKDDNLAAIRCYEKLGFSVHSAYEEFMVTTRKREFAQP